MNIEIAIKHGSESVHYINLLRNENGQKDGEYTFILRHNALGEVPSADDREYSTSMGYVSFPIAGIIDGDSAKIAIEWKSFKMENGWYDLTKSESISKEFNWNRSGYEHTPASAQLKSAAVLK
jgi:hypothetical protein